MTNTLTAQGWLFLYTVLAGAGIGLFYDFFRVLRRVFAHASWVTQVEDFLFWVIATATMFYFMLSQNYGEIRPFVLLGALCGAALYFSILSRHIVKTLVWIINYCIKILASAWKIITAPIRFIYKLVSPRVKSFLIKRRKNLHTLRRYGKIKASKALRNFYILRKKV